MVCIKMIPSEVESNTFYDRLSEYIKKRVTVMVGYLKSYYFKELLETT